MNEYSKYINWHRTNVMEYEFYRPYVHYSAGIVDMLQQVGYQIASRNSSVVCNLKREPVSDLLLSHQHALARMWSYHMAYWTHAQCTRRTLQRNITVSYVVGVNLWLPYTSLELSVGSSYENPAVSRSSWNQNNTMGKAACYMKRFICAIMCAQ